MAYHHYGSNNLITEDTIEHKSFSGFFSAHLLANEVKTHQKKCDTLEQQEVEMHSLSCQQTPNRCSEQQKR